MLKPVLLALFLPVIYCNGQIKPAALNFMQEVQQPLRNIRSIFQDKKGNYWFGTNDSGVFRYNGKILEQFSEKDGLSNNQVQNIQEDHLGQLWFSTGVFGVSKFDGKKITTWSKKENIGTFSFTSKDWKIEKSDLWFYAGGGVYRLQQDSLVYIPLHNPENQTKEAPNSPFSLNSYGVYSILKDTKGNIWFGTQAQGVCRYDGKSFSWLTEKGLRGPAVLSIFEDSKGNIWFGNNGSGLFKYDGKSLIHVTKENGLMDTSFPVSGKSLPGTLSRIYTINEDNYHNIWIGTVDNGVWRYDGKDFLQYTTKDGLSSNAVNIIYKDQKGDLWFGTDSHGICKFNGKSFEVFH